MNNTGDDNGDIQNDSRSSQTGAVTVYARNATGELLAKVLDKSRKASDGDNGSVDASGAVEEVRRIRRGKFFLSNYEQTNFGSLRRPIFLDYCHGVVVGLMEEDLSRDGMWCYGAHQDFDLIPESHEPHEWPEYKRTSTGFDRIDKKVEFTEPSKALTDLLSTIQNVKRLV